MRLFFYLGFLLWIAFEGANVYFVMPMPGSQEFNSIDVAWFLHHWRWGFRLLFLLLMFAGYKKAWEVSPFLTILPLLLGVVVTYFTNFKMSADHMFYQPSKVSLRKSDLNEVDLNRIVLGVEYNHEVKAYPIQYLAFHHQVRDSLGGKPIMVTYCTVCRSGRVFEPIVNQHVETFRLVGMDHYNAMFEDNTTKSWWRQENGEAIAGPMKGQLLPELPAVQMSLSTWLQIHPESFIFQPDTTFAKDYADESDFEAGRRKGKLTVYDTTSWNAKSWIAGVIIDDKSKAYDWNKLKAKKVIHDVVNDIPIVILLTDEDKSLFGFKVVDSAAQFAITNDTLYNAAFKYDLQGHAFSPGIPNLIPITVYQEYWHSWKTFHPDSQQDE